MEKKEYIAPKMDVIELKAQNALLQCSDCDGPDATEYDGEFGLIGNPMTDRHA